MTPRYAVVFYEIRSLRAVSQGSGDFHWPRFDSDYECNLQLFQVLLSYFPNHRLSSQESECPFNLLSVLAVPVLDREIALKPRWRFGSLMQPVFEDIILSLHNYIFLKDVAVSSVKVATKATTRLGFMILRLAN